ncbi:nucleotidyltransferase domain-containing protein, partial [Candidatus Woesearchaeota archaeon]|nr:nucleotidyltransferase domain-containing protein [Candidatus Woesearchaeota archaeon]
MGKKDSKSIRPKNIKAIKEEKSEGLPLLAQNQPKLPPEVEKKLEALKGKLDTFKTKVLDKFGDYIVGIALLPPKKMLPKSDEIPETAAPKEESEDKSKEEKAGEEQKMNFLVLVDDTTSQKMSKEELHQKFSTIVTSLAKEIDKNFEPQSVLLTDLWQDCYDAKYELNKLISLSAPIYDTGMLAAIKISEVHKSMVIKKFDKYILSYVLAGSLTQGKATPTSDIDVWIVIDDTDVKKMTRVELKDKLRAIIIGMGIEAGQLTGIQNKLNIQVYILTDFWESLKEANPIIFTLLRDGVPFYDRGIFMPWKQLLRMGRIKPSREAIDLFMSTGEQTI